jgi:hypothetical protein
MSLQAFIKIIKNLNEASTGIRGDIIQSGQDKSKTLPEFNLETHKNTIRRSACKYC